MTNHEAMQLEAAIEHALAASNYAQAASLVAEYEAGAVSAGPARDPAASLAVRAAYQAVRVGVAEGQLARAWQRVQPLLALTDRLPAPFGAHIHLLAAEALARLGRGEAARTQLARLQRWAREVNGDPYLQFCALRIRLWLGDVRAVTTQVAQCAAKLGTQERIALLTEEGRAWERAGDLGRAGRCWQAAEALLSRDCSGSVAADLYLQLGRLAHLRGHLQEALNYYQRAGKYAATVPAHALNVALRRLWVLVDLNHERQARDELERLCPRAARAELPEEVRGVADLLDALLNPDALAVDEPEVHAYRAIHVHGDPAHLAVAYRCYATAFAQEQSSERRARLAIMLAMLALARGPTAGTTDADDWLAKAETLAGDASLPEVRWRVLRLRAEHVQERHNDEAQARALLEQAVRILLDQVESLHELGHRSTYRQQAGTVLDGLLLGACRRGDAARAFQFQELVRGRQVLEIFSSVPNATASVPEVRKLDDAIRAIERQAEAADASALPALRSRRNDLLLERERLWERYLCDRSRPATATLPALPELAELQRVLPRRTVFVAPKLFEHELYLLVVRRGASRITRCAVPRTRMLEQAAGWHTCLTAQAEQYRSGRAMGPRQRAELDACLDELGQGPLGTALTEVWDALHPGERLVWVPDSQLIGVPVHALRRDGRYLVQDRDVVYTLSGSLYAYHARLRRPGWLRRSRAVIVTAPAVEHGGESGLPGARYEGQGVAAAFGRAWTLHHREATHERIENRLRRVGVAHFACHAMFDPDRPLSSYVHLPCGKPWYALEWLAAPVAGLPLVMLSTCHSAEMAPALGGETFGLVQGLLSAGVRAVVGGLCPIPDRETSSFMWRFYRHAITHDVAGALACAQRETIAEAYSSPFFWATFALFGDAAALPAPGWLGRWWAARRQRRHARAFPARAHGD